MNQLATTFPAQAVDSPAARFVQGDRVVLFRVRQWSGTCVYSVTNRQWLPTLLQATGYGWHYQVRLLGPAGELVGEQSRPIAEDLVAFSSL